PRSRQRGGLHRHSGLRACLRPAGTRPQRAPDGQLPLLRRFGCAIAGLARHWRPAGRATYRQVKTWKLCAGAAVVGMVQQEKGAWLSRVSRAEREWLTAAVLVWRKIRFPRDPVSFPVCLTVMLERYACRASGNRRHL